MAPFKEFKNWNKRDPANSNQIEPYRKYYFLCEGENTEKWYFEELINRKKELGIHPLIDIRFLERTEEDVHNSHPKRLLEYAKQLKKQGLNDFDLKHDKFILVFDADVFSKKPQAYYEIIHEAKEEGFIVAVTNPSFELFLLLHKNDAYEKYIKPKADEILQNKKTGQRKAVQIIFTDATGVNPKTNDKICEFAKNIDIAIEQESNLNQNTEECIGKLTSNVAQTINNIRKDSIY